LLEVEILRFQDSRHMVIPTHKPPLPSRKYSWYSFLLEAESTPGPQCGRKIMSTKNSEDTIENRTHDLPACSAVPQSTAPPAILTFFSKTKKSYILRQSPTQKNVKTENFQTTFLHFNSLLLKLIIRYSSLVKFVQRPIENS